MCAVFVGVLKIVCVCLHWSLIYLFDIHDVMNVIYVIEDRGDIRENRAKSRNFGM